MYDRMAASTVLQSLINKLVCIHNGKISVYNDPSLNPLKLMIMDSHLE